MELIKDFFVSLLNWSVLSGIASAVATCFLAYVACKELGTWKQQAHFRIKIEFIDELLDSVHDYINVIGSSVDELKYIEIAIKSYSNTGKADNTAFENYVKQHGGDDGRTLSEYLKQAYPIKSKVMTLKTKGQVMGFRNYSKCFNACTLIIDSFDKMQVVASTIQSKSYYWKNIEVQKLVSDCLKIKASDLKEAIEGNHTILLEYTRELYKELLL